ncbi:MAG: subtilin biosynthesis sensor protein SpaK [Eubacterium sp.]|nr:subtilin biosynthesis sensor protein SpaK [Eubacterium sp.]
MKYVTTNEWKHFGFLEAYISDIQKVGGCFQLILDNVKIAPENSKNRDIREMRANALCFRIQDAELLSLTEEGYKVYNADGQLKNQYEDREIPQECWNDKLKSFTDGECCLYALEKTEEVYTLIIDASDGHTYILRVSGTRDTEEWDRFLQP